MKLFKSIILIPIWLIYSFPFLFLDILFFPLFFIIFWLLLKLIFQRKGREETMQEIKEWLEMVTLPATIPCHAFIHYYNTETFLEF